MSDVPAGTTAPAPVAPSTPEPPPLAPLAAASAAIREEWSRTPPPESAEAAAPSPTPEPEPTPEGPPRGEDGKFVKKEEVAAPEGDAPASPPDGEPEPAPATPESAPEGEGLVVALPGRHPHDPPVEIEVTDPEVAERLRQLNNGFMRGEEVRQEKAQIDQNWSQIAEVEETIQTDPVGFVRSQLPPEYAPRLALQILSDPAVLKVIQKDLAELLNPATTRTKQAELKAEMYETRDQLKLVRQERQAGERNAQEVRSAVAAMIPPEYDGEKAGAFLRDALNDLSDYATRHQLDRMDVEQLPILLAQRLQRAGINPVQAAQRMASMGREGKKTTASRVGPPTGRPTGVPGRTTDAAPTARPTGEKFVQGQARRKAVAVTPPAGAGTPSAPVAPPRGTTLKEATALARARRRS